MLSLFGLTVPAGATITCSHISEKVINASFLFSNSDSRLVG